ncbi:MAG: hypothetical protein JSV09_01305, partial [Thermoplasmata archaeon]
MNRRIVAIWVCLTVMSGFIVIVDVTMDFSLNVGGATLYVNKTGSGGAYTIIQEAIDNASIGDTVFVYSGSYSERLVIDTTINLTGENRDTTVINGGGIGNVIRVTAQWVNISGFRITNGNNGIYVSDPAHKCN